KLEPELLGELWHGAVAIKDELPAALDRDAIGQCLGPDAATHPAARLEYLHLASCPRERTRTSETCKARSDYDYFGSHSHPNRQYWRAMLWVPDSIAACVGRTPVVQITRLLDDSGVSVFAKLEAFNPGGSVKDRIGVSMIEAAERDRLIEP